MKDKESNTVGKTTEVSKSTLNDLLYCVVCKFDKSKFEENKKNMSRSAYFGEPSWDRSKPVLFKDRVTNQWVVECQNCGMHLMLHESTEEETIKQWNDIERAI